MKKSGIPESERRIAPPYSSHIWPAARLATNSPPKSGASNTRSSRYRDGTLRTCTADSISYGIQYRARYRPIAIANATNAYDAALLAHDPLMVTPRSTKAAAAIVVAMIRERRASEREKKPLT